MVTCFQGPSPGRVSFETSFDSKQPMLEPKLVSALSKTKRLFWLFLFYTETESFSVSIEMKQTEEQPKQCDREQILVFLSENLGLFRVVLVCFGLFRNSLFQLFRFYTETESFDVSIEPKQTEDQPKQFDREHILVFFRKFRVVSVCFETVLFVSVALI
jgi:hypothetical protein